jgi:hypothetical protein
MEMRFRCVGRIRLSMGLLSWLMFVSPMLQADEPVVDHSDLMSYLDESGQRQPIRNQADWGKRRQQIISGMEQAMGPLPPRDHLPDFDVEVLERTSGPGYRRETIRFTTEKADRLPADLYIPQPLEAGEKRPAVLALHPTGPLGKRIVAGEAGKANREYALELAQRGYVVLAPDYPPFGDYKYDFNADDYVSGSMKGIFNHLRCVDLLSSLPAVDPDRMGVIGHSLGGHNAMFLGVFDPRVKVIISSCGWCPFHDYYGGKLAGWASDRYMPRLRDRYELNPDKVPFDFYEVVAALAPRDFFSCSPLHDANFDVAGVRKAIPRAREIYALFGAEDHLQVRYPDCEHDFPTPTRFEAYQLLDRVFHHQPAPHDSPKN